MMPISDSNHCGAVGYSWLAGQCSFVLFVLGSLTLVNIEIGESDNVDGKFSEGTRDYFLRQLLPTKNRW